MDKDANGFRRLAFVGNYLPRQCGIATFTTDLCEAVAASFAETTCFAVPVNDRPEGYVYPARVRFEIVQDDLSTYCCAADFLNINNVDLVCLQHEYGIFGGPAGSHVLALLRQLHMPVVTTLHTVLREPDPTQRKVMLALAELSDRLVVMSPRAVQFLQDIYGVPAEKIDLIHHGIPDVPFVDPNFHKDKFGVEGKLVLLTFGLLSPNKGIEHAIEALPAILERYSRVVYIVLGATHPHVKRNDGETYRLGLQQRAELLGVAGHVLFHNRFVSLDELVEFIGAADIYVTPYLNPAQIVSGTLAYSVGAGKAVVSTPYWYAEDLLAESRGVLVPFADPGAIAECVVALLDNEAERHAMRKRAYLLGREMIWPQVARRYMESFQHTREVRRRLPRPAWGTRRMDSQPAEWPAIRLDHLQRMTDQTGILQHALFAVPNYHEGYSTDDNARGLITAVLLGQFGPAAYPQAIELAVRYLGFLNHALDRSTGRFRNFLGYDRQWCEPVGSDDCHGRAIWALGVVAGRSRHAELGGPANELISFGLPACPALTSPRAWAFTLIGLDEYLRAFAGDSAAQNLRDVLTGRLMDLYDQYSSADWQWFEDSVTYANATLPHALLLSGSSMSRGDAVEVGRVTLGWLAKIQQLEKDHFVPIGSLGFYMRGKERARFDQQPIEAQGMVSACLAAHRITGERHWYNEAKRAFAWFLGRNDLRLSLYDPRTGGCRDGLHPDSVNQNEGAESTLSFLLSLLELRLAENALSSARDGAPLVATPADPTPATAQRVAATASARPADLTVKKPTIFAQ